MKLIQTKSFIKISSDLKRQPSTFPGENDGGQSMIFLPRKKKKPNKNPVRKIYQLGINTPVLETDLDITQRPHLGML